MRGSVWDFNMCHHCRADTVEEKDGLYYYECGSTRDRANLFESKDKDRSQRSTQCVVNETIDGWVEFIFWTCVVSFYILCGMPIVFIATYPLFITDLKARAIGETFGVDGLTRGDLMTVCLCLTVLFFLLVKYLMGKLEKHVFDKMENINAEK